MSILATNQTRRNVPQVPLIRYFHALRKRMSSTLAPLKRTTTADAVLNTTTVPKGIAEARAYPFPIAGVPEATGQILFEAKSASFPNLVQTRT